MFQLKDKDWGWKDGKQLRASATFVADEVQFPANAW